MGSELARLHDEGVGYGALDALQGQFLAQFIETERLRYMNIGKGPFTITPHVVAAAAHNVQGSRAYAYATIACLVC